MFFVHDREIPLYSVSDAGAHLYSNIQLLSDLTIKTAWLGGVLVKHFLTLFYIITDLTNTVRNLSRNDKTHFEKYSRAVYF